MRRLSGMISKVAQDVGPGVGHLQVCSLVGNCKYLQVLHTNMGNRPKLM